MNIMNCEKRSETESNRRDGVNIYVSKWRIPLTSFGGKNGGLEY